MNVTCIDYSQKDRPQLHFQADGVIANGTETRIVKPYIHRIDTITNDPATPTSISNLARAAHRGIDLTLSQDWLVMAIRWPPPEG